MRCTIITLVLLAILGNHMISYAMEYHMKEELGKKEVSEDDITLICKDDEKIVVPYSLALISNIYKESLALDMGPCDTLYCPDLLGNEIVLLIPLCSALAENDMQTVQERLSHYTQQQLLIIGKIVDYLDISLLASPLAEALVACIPNIETLLCADDDASDDIFLLPADVQHIVARLLLDKNSLRRSIVENKNSMRYFYKYNNSESIASACWSSDSNCIALQSSNMIQVKDANTGDHISSFVHENGTIVSINWPANSDDIYLLDSNNIIHYWNFVSSEIYCLGELPLSQKIHSASWSADSAYVLVQLIDNSLVVYDTKTGAPLYTCYEYVGDNYGGMTIRWSPNGKYIALSIKNAIHLWDTKTWKNLHTFHHGNRGITSCQWSADSCYIASGGYNGKACIWEMHTWKNVAILPHKLGIERVSINHNGTYLASVLLNNMIYIWNIEKKKKCYGLSNMHWISNIYWSPDSNTILVIFPNYNICLWEVKNIYALNNLNLEQALLLEILKNEKNKDGIVGQKRRIFSYKRYSSYLSSLFVSLPFSLKQIIASSSMGLLGILAGMNIVSKYEESPVRDA